MHLPPHRMVHRPHPPNGLLHLQRTLRQSNPPNALHLQTLHRQKRHRRILRDRRQIHQGTPRKTSTHHGLLDGSRHRRFDIHRRHFTAQHARRGFIGYGQIGPHRATHVRLRRRQRRRRLCVHDTRFRRGAAGRGGQSPLDHERHRHAGGASEGSPHRRVARFHRRRGRGLEVSRRHGSGVVGTGVRPRPRIWASPSVRDGCGDAIVKVRGDGGIRRRRRCEEEGDDGGCHRGVLFGARSGGEHGGGGDRGVRGDVVCDGGLQRDGRGSSRDAGAEEVCGGVGGVAGGTGWRGVGGSGGVREGV
mmetsp:Transcript_1234/g.2391  ORF Transcript_1234/g.2391 Transcript_1234/m.2391 type:complete len:304 (-) Transcript_1234:100-1011(-)